MTPTAPAGQARLSIDVVGIPLGSSGWATHSMEFSRAMRALASVNFRTRKKNAVRCLLGADAGMMLRGMFRPPGDYGVVIAGQPRRKEATSRWIVWETTVLPPAQRALCESVEHLWVPSTWGRSNLIANGFDDRRISVVPEGVDTRFFHPGPREQDGRPFRFLMVGKWEERKFCDGLLRAFTSEFAPSENVELYLQAHNPYAPGFSLADKVAAVCGRTEHRIVLGSPCNKLELRALYRSADCFVLPTRAEGWGLPILEAMACGTPAMVTGYSAPLDFVTPENGFLIDVAAMVEARDAEFGIDSGLWAQPDIGHLRHLMREVFQQPELLQMRRRPALDTASRFDWAASAASALRAIRARTPA